MPTTLLNGKIADHRSHFIFIKLGLLLFTLLFYICIILLLNFFIFNLNILIHFLNQFIMYLFYTFKINYRLNVIYPFLSNVFLFILLSEFEKIKEPENNA